MIGDHANCQYEMYCSHSKMNPHSAARVIEDFAFGSLLALKEATKCQTFIVGTSSREYLESTRQSIKNSSELPDAGHPLLAALLYSRRDT